MTPFAGWEMPVQYSSIIEEHLAVREKAGLFDISHMGEILLQGKNASTLLDSLTCNTVLDLPVGRLRYNAVLNKTGGVVDDITIYRSGEETFTVVSNASNYKRVFAYLAGEAPKDCTVEDKSDVTHLIAIQGILAEDLLQKTLQCDTTGIVYYGFQDFDLNGESVRISRNGYTGEDGFEIYSSNDFGVQLWDRLLEHTQSGLRPVGLAARDTLRLEAGYCLYGHELSDELTPVESGLGWIVKDKAADYPQKEKLLAQKAKGPQRRVTGFKLTESGVPREGYPVLSISGEVIGNVLSGGYSPVLKCGIGTALLPGQVTPDQAIAIEIRGRPVPALTHKGAFVAGTAGKKKP